MSLSKKRDFAAGVLSVSGPPHPIYDPIHTPIHNLYMYTVYLYTPGKGEGGGELTREKV
jgi:hypothetical protein